MMGLSDRQSSSKLWRISIFAKAEGLVTAELQLASARAADKKVFSSFLARIVKKRSSKQNQDEGALYDASLRVRARLFFLKIRVAAGRLCELRLDSPRQGSLIHIRTSSKASLFAPESFQIFKGSSSCSPSPGRAPSWLSRVLLWKRERKGSLLLCGASMGTMIAVFLYHACSLATHFPAFALNAGSRAIGLFAKFISSKCESTGFKGAACFWQGVRGTISIFQILMSLIRPFLAANRIVSTALLAVLIGVILMGKANKLQDFLDRKTKGGARILKAKLAMKLLLVTQLIRRFWAHIGMKQACVVVLLLAFLMSAMVGLNGETK